MKNRIIIISGPSGAGEDSIIDALEKILPVENVITTTTREMRPGESQANPYYFISRKDFLEKIDKGEFFEYAQEYNDNYYGVTNEELNRFTANGKIGLWKIEYKGVITVKSKLPEIKAIFIIAPLEVLEQRIRRRTQVTEDFVKERMNYTKEWLKHREIYDYEVENVEGKLKETIEKVTGIIKREFDIDKK